MEELIYLEVLDRGGRVRKRHRLTQFPVIVGRDYSCDIMLDDEYVSGRHLRLEHDAAGMLIAADLKSDNGSYFGASTLPAKRANLGTETLLRIGRTQLRLRKPDFPVAPARALNGRAGHAGAWLSRTWVFVLVLALTAGMLLLEGYLGQFVKAEWARRSFVLVPLMMLLTLWAGPWALASRLFTHEANYLAHANIACLGLLGFFLLDYAYEYLSFAYSLAVSAEAWFLCLMAVVLGLMLFGHLRYSTLQPTQRLLVAGGVSAALLVGLVGFAQHVSRQDFSAQLDYSTTLKPLDYKRAASHAPAAFIDSLTTLKEAVDLEVEE